MDKGGWEVQTIRPTRLPFWLMQAGSRRAQRRTGKTCSMRMQHGEESRRKSRDREQKCHNGHPGLTGVLSHVKILSFYRNEERCIPMADLHSEAADALFKAILSLRSEEECYAFFEDLCTVGELQAMSQRYHVARLLRAGLVYSEVGRLSGASSATISRVNRCLQYGSGGYRLLLDRVEQDTGSEE